MHYVCSLIKVLEKNSDLKTQQSFEAVIGLLKTCKEGAVERIFRWKFSFLSFAFYQNFPYYTLAPSLVFICCLCFIQIWSYTVPSVYGRPPRSALPAM